MTVLHVIFCDLFSAGKKEHSPNTLWDTRYPKWHAEVRPYVSAGNAYKKMTAPTTQQGAFVGTDFRSFWLSTSYQIGPFDSETTSSRATEGSVAPKDDVHGIIS
jgi:hypothetical protein